MPRAGWVNRRPTSGCPTHLDRCAHPRFPPDLVDQVVKEAGRTEQRNGCCRPGGRLLRARPALFSQCAYEEVMRLWSRACLGNRAGRTRGTSPQKRRCSKPARGSVPSLGGPLPSQRGAACGQSDKGAFYRSWRLMSIDGTCLDVADTSANELAFGRPGRNARTASEPFPRSGSSGLANAVPMPSSTP